MADPPGSHPTHMDEYQYWIVRSSGCELSAKLFNILIQELSLDYR